MKLSRTPGRLLIAALSLVTWSALNSYAGDAAKIIVRADQTGIPVASTMHGLFFEDINYGADGGLYAELIQNRSFEHRDALYGWSQTARGGTQGRIVVENESPLNANNRNFLRIYVTTPGQGGCGAVNSGFEGIVLREGENYLLSLYARRRAGEKAALRIQLEDAGGKVLATANIAGLGPDWKKHEFTLKSSATETNAYLAVLATEAGVVDVDMVSLFPEKTFKGRRNGLRADLAQALADMKPGFLRFPGGCIVEGKDFGNMYRWKDTIGDVAERKENWNLWQDPTSPQYSQTYGLGFYEYFQFCEDIGAEPVTVVNIGMTCQARRGRHVPLDQIEPYLQDALDLIEFANGPADSFWGAKRAAMGHPKPFNMKFLAVGNEQWQQEYFDRYAVFQPVLKARYPEIQFISTSGPLAEDALWKFAWNKFKTGTPADVVDEHYYVAPQWLLENINRYTSYDRTGPKIFVGEFAGHDRGRHNNLRSALSEAAYMTGLEQNADVVIMASYAPLFAKIGHVQWRPDLIWFDNAKVMLTPNYYAQALFMQNRPDVVFPTSVESPLIRPPKAMGKIGVGSWNSEVEYKDFKVVSANGRTLFESDFSKGMDGWKTAGGEWKVVDGALKQSAIVENARAVVGDPSWSDYTLTLKARKISGQEGFLIIYETEDINSPVWWNLGGWSNSDHVLQGVGMPEERMPGKIDTNHWYDVKIVSSADGVAGYLDGKLVQKGSRRPVASVYAVGGTRVTDETKELVLSVVNYSAEPRETTIQLQGVSRLARMAKLTLLTSASPDDVNTIGEPAKVAPVTENIEIPGPNFTRVFPPNSLSVIQLELAK